MSNPTWEAFVAGLVDHYTQRGDRDRTLWRVTKADREIVCRERARTVEGFIGLELRVEHNGQVFRTELHNERVAFYRRVEELRAMLEPKAGRSRNNGSPFDARPASP
jgi:hypothetical protein